MRLSVPARRVATDRRVQASAARSMPAPVGVGRSLRDGRPPAGRKPAIHVRPAFRVPWARLVGATGVIAAAWSLHWLVSDPTFVVDAASVPVEGARFATPAEVRSRLGLVAGRDPNLFLVPTSDMERSLEELPGVRSASVVASLPDGLTVRVIEREPIAIWRTSTGSWLADVEGVLFAPEWAAGTPLPAVEDLRPIEVAPGLGDRLAPIDLEVARLLGALRPKDLGGNATELLLTLDETSGWVIEAPDEWRAIFGHYTPTLRPPATVERQVQCLAALLARENVRVDAVTLSVTADRCGTFTGPSARQRRERNTDTEARRAGKRSPAPTRSRR
jgi:hypothetical protein